MLSVFPKVDQQRAVDVIQQSLRAGKKYYWDNRNMPQVTFTTGSTKMSTSAGKEENFNGRKFEQSFGATESLRHHNERHVPSYNYLEPSSGRVNQPAFVGGSTMSTNLSSNLSMGFSQVKFDQYLPPKSPKLDSTTKENGKQKFKCENCEETFQNAENLQMHIVGEHKGARSHPCPDCGKTFQSASGMKQHHHIHASYKPYECKVCKRAYTQFSNLCRHKRNNVACQTKKQCQKCARVFRSSSDTNTICECCKERSSAKATHEKPKAKKKLSKNVLIQAASKNNDSRTELVLDNFPFPQLEKLCSSVPKTPSNTRSSIVNALPPRKRLWDAAFLSETTNLSKADSNDDAKRVCDAQVQCNVGNSSFAIANFQARNFEKNNCNDRMNFASNVAIAKTSINLGKVSEEKKASSGKTLSCSPVLPFSLSHPPPKKRFLQRALPHSAAAAIADKYLYCCSLEKKPKSISIANNHHNHFPSTNIRSTANVRIDAKHLQRNEPLDLRVKKQKLCNSNTNVSQADVNKNNAYSEPSGSQAGSDKNQAWNQSLDLFFKVGQRYGSFLPWTFERADKLYSKTSNLANLLRQDMHWQQKFGSLYLSFAKNVPQPSSPSVSNPSSTSQTQQTSSCISNTSLSVKNKNGMDSKLSAQANPCSKRNCRGYCPRSFPNTVNVARRERTHSGRQPYSCTTCKKSASVSSNVHRHVKNIHNKETTNLQPLQCAITRHYDEQEKLERHLREHRDLVKDAWRLSNDSSPKAVSDSEANAQSNSFSSDNSPVQERRISSASRDSSEPTTPFRPWNQGSDYTDDSSSSPLSVKSVGSSEETKSPDFYYPDTSNSSSLKFMTNQVMTSLSLLSGSQAAQA